MEMEKALENAPSITEAPPTVLPEIAKEELADRDNGDLVLGDEAPESTWQILRKRRLFPGAITSHEEFDGLFESLDQVNDEFQSLPGEGIENPDTVKKYGGDIRSKSPRFCNHMVRLSTAALAIFCLRTADMSMRERALMLWILEGTDFLRFHEGDRVAEFLLGLEGLFRRLPEGLARDPGALLEAIRQQWEDAGEDNATLMRRCVKSAVSNVGENLLKGRGGDEGLDVDADVQNWRFHAARVVLQLKVRLARELAEDKLLRYMVEWCEIPKKAAPICCFEDCCVEYCENGVARQARKSQSAFINLFPFTCHCSCSTYTRRVGLSVGIRRRSGGRKSQTPMSEFRTN